MAIVTITSDLGTRDYYLAALKGAILSQSPTALLADVTSQIKAFDIKEAAYTVRNAYRYFPKGTIHVVHVNSSDSKSKLLLALADGHSFLTFDNGFLSIAFEKMPHEIYQINEELLTPDSLLHEDAIAKVISLLFAEYRPTDFAQLTTNVTSYKSIQPVPSGNSLRAAVVSIDNFGNCVLNITRQMFDDFVGNRSFTVMANVGSTNAVSKNYSEVDEGDMVCLFNSGGYLEVAINKAKAENLLGLKIDSPVLILLN
jgi:S-adenosylmethionine hydrolase